MEMTSLALVELGVTGSSVEEPPVFDMVDNESFHR